MRKAISILFFLLLSLPAMAQNRQPEELYFNHLFVKDGMPEGMVTSIVQDKEGYMWIGTQKGLVRYDGYKPKVYNFDIEDPYFQDIRILYIDREDRLWGGGQYGVLLLYDRSEDRFIKYNPYSSTFDSSRLPILSIREDKHGNIWVAGYDENIKKSRLARFDPSTKKFTIYNDTEKGTHHLNTTQVTHLVEVKGEIWFGSGNGIYHYNDKTDRLDSYLATADSAKQITFYMSEKASQPGILWMVPYDSKPDKKNKGLWRYDTRTRVVTVFRHHTGDSSSLGNDNINSMHRDSLRRMWVVTDNGLSFFDSTKNNFINYHFKDENTGKFSSMYEMNEDKNGNFWLATSIGFGFL